MLGQVHYIKYGLERIPFELQPRKSNIYRVLIKVHSDCRVVVQAPVSASNSEIIQAVNKRAGWVYRHYSHFKKQLEHITPRNYISGESHYYLGRKYLLRIMIDPIAKPQTKLLRGMLEVRTKSKYTKNIKATLFDWYKERAREIFNKRLDAILSQAFWVAERPQIRLVTMQTQWGSCSPTGKLTLNPHLVKAPIEYIDYVILHELCHLVEHNHSLKFYRLMKQIMPNWEKTKDKIDSMANFLLNGV